MTVWALIGAMALATFLCRALPLVWLTDPQQLPAPVRRWLGYMPPAVLAALVAPAILPGGGPWLRPELLLYAICLAVALFTRRLLPPLLAAGSTWALLVWLG